MSEPDPNRLLGALLDRAGVAVAVLDAEGRYVYVNDRLAEVNGVPVDGHIGRTVRDVIPHLADTVEASHAEVMRTRAPIRDFQVRGSTRGAPNRTWLVSYLPIDFGGHPAVGAVLMDTTERDAAGEQAQRRARQHAAVADLGQRALAGMHVKELLDAASAVVRRELAADQAGVLEFTSDRSHLIMCSGDGFPESAVGRVTADLGRRSQAGLTLLTGGPVLTEDLETEDRFDVSAIMRSQGARSTISTRIPGPDGDYGVLGVFSQRPSHFDEDDAGFVRAVANVLGAAVVREAQGRELSELSGQRGRLVAQALEAGEREQRQVADILHDDVLQHLLFARQELAMTPGDEAARARESVEQATSTLRGVVAGLHPVTLAHAGLAAAIESLAREHQARVGLKVDVRVEPAATGLRDRLVVSLVRELLVNVVKHAGARRASVRVGSYDHGLRIEVADDGRGMPADAFTTALAQGNMGLATVRERVEALGGRATVSSGLDGRGTGVEIVVPD